MPPAVRPTLIALAAVGTACASGTSSIPTFSPDRVVPLPESAVTQIHLAAVRHFRRSGQQIMCIGVTSNREFDSRTMAVDAPEIFLRLLGSRNQYRPASACRTSESDMQSVRPTVTTLGGQTATALKLGRPFGLAEDRAVVNVEESSRTRSGQHRCEAGLAEGEVWQIVRCVRERG